MSGRDSTLQLIYASAATETFSAAALKTLLLRARANNLRLGVSGLLVHHKGSFFQVLEGVEGIVDTLYRKISEDRRHHRVLTLARGVVTQRSFGDWTMGFAELASGDAARLPGFNDFFRRGLELAHSTDGPARAKDLALAFRDGRFRQFIDGS